MASCQAATRGVICTHYLKRAFPHLGEHFRPGPGRRVRRNGWTAVLSHHSPGLVGTSRHRGPCPTREVISILWLKRDEFKVRDRLERTIIPTRLYRYDSAGEF
jgi:hypothetical protein